MGCRDFVFTGTGAVALAALPQATHAQARPKDVLVVANEFGPIRWTFKPSAPTAPVTASAGFATTGS